MNAFSGRIKSCGTERVKPWGRRQYPNLRFDPVLNLISSVLVLFPEVGNPFVRVESKPKTVRRGEFGGKTNVMAIGKTQKIELDSCLGQRLCLIFKALSAGIYRGHLLSYQTIFEVSQGSQQRVVIILG